MKHPHGDAQMKAFECYVCGRLLRGPVGWELDSQGFERCPKHREVSKALTTLGELQAKAAR